MAMVYRIRIESLTGRLAERQQEHSGERPWWLDVLFEKPGRYPDQVVGRSPYLQAVHVSGTADLIGRIVPVTIQSAAKMSLAGKFENQLEPA